jgi:hypothetical protein
MEHREAYPHPTRSDTIHLPAFFLYGTETTEQRKNEPTGHLCFPLNIPAVFCFTPSFVNPVLAEEQNTLLHQADWRNEGLGDGRRRRRVAWVGLLALSEPEFP